MKLSAISLLSKYLILFMVIVCSSPLQAKEALLECKLENRDTIVKLKEKFLGGYDVYFHQADGWDKRSITKQDDLFIWIKSNYGYTETEGDSCNTRCDYDFKLELLENEYKADWISRKWIDIHRIADNSCLRDCRRYDKGEVISTIDCDIKKRFD